MARKITVRTAKSQSRALVAVPSASVAIPVDGIVVRDGDTTLVTGAPYVMRGKAIPAAEVYYVRGLKGREDGPWLGEADKLAWRDPASGYECIILRAERGGHLCGYVGVPPEHPLHGFDERAIPAELDIEVHGGVTYSRLCQHGPSSRAGVSVEARLVCHVARPAPPKPISHATDYRVEDGDAWWLGFECNHAYDLLPNDERRPTSFLEREIGQTYRDEAYVYDQVVGLAAQLKAIADGLPKPKLPGSAPPPIGLDPTEAC